MMPSEKLSTAELLFRQASKMGLKPSWVLQDGLFVISTPQGERYIHQATSPLNTHVGASLARDKYLTRVILGRQGVPNIPYAQPKSLLEARMFLDTYRKIIVKPRRGSGAHDIRIVESFTQLLTTPLDNTIFEKYIAGREMRYLILNDQVVSVQESRYGTSVQEDRYLERIAYEPADWNPERMAMSLRIAKIMGLRFAAIDYLIDEADAFYLLEVNANPGLKWFHAPTAGPPVDVAALFLEAIVS